MKLNTWTMVTKPNPNAKVRLFCFPYAGSGASIFRDWHSHLPEQVEVVGIQLPGRENRFSEERFTGLETVVQALRGVISNMADKPCYFFGHSLGALIAFELTRLLQRERLPSPFHLVVSGTPAPQLPRRDEPLHLLDDDSFQKRVAEFNGTPKALLQDAELMTLFVPVLRDDFTICETYRHDDDTLLQCPLTALGGDWDTDVAIEDLAAWSEAAGSGFEYYTFPGDHFFIHPNKAKVGELLASIGRREIQCRGDKQELNKLNFAEGRKQGVRASVAVSAGSDHALDRPRMTNSVVDRRQRRPVLSEGAKRQRE